MLSTRPAADEQSVEIGSGKCFFAWLALRRSTKLPAPFWLSFLSAEAGGGGGGGGGVRIESKNGAQSICVFYLDHRRRSGCRAVFRAPFKEEVRRHSYRCLPLGQHQTSLRWPTPRERSATVSELASERVR